MTFAKSASFLRKALAPASKPPPSTEARTTGKVCAEALLSARGCEVKVWFPCRAATPGWRGGRGRKRGCFLQRWGGAKQGRRRQVPLTAAGWCLAGAALPGEGGKAGKGGVCPSLKGRLAVARVGARGAGGARCPAAAAARGSPDLQQRPRRRLLPLVPPQRGAGPAAEPI